MSSLIEDSKILKSASVFNLLRLQYVMQPLEISSLCSCKNESKKGKFLWKQFWLHGPPWGRQATLRELLLWKAIESVTSPSPPTRGLVNKPLLPLHPLSSSLSITNLFSLPLLLLASRGRARPFTPTRSGVLVKLKNMYGAIRLGQGDLGGLWKKRSKNFDFFYHSLFLMFHSWWLWRTSDVSWARTVYMVGFAGSEYPPLWEFKHLLGMLYYLPSLCLQSL